MRIISEIALLAALALNDYILLNDDGKADIE